MGDVATSIGLQAVVGALARTGDTDFDLHRILRALAELAQSYSGAAGVALEQTRDGEFSIALKIGQLSGTPRRMPIMSEGAEIGFLALYGTHCDHCRGQSDHRSAGPGAGRCRQADVRS